MSNETFLEFFKKKIFFTYTFRKFGVNTVFLPDSNLFFQKSISLKFDKINFENIC